jgi:hypothetical protein
MSSLMVRCIYPISKAAQRLTCNLNFLPVYFVQWDFRVLYQNLHILITSQSNILSVSFIFQTLRTMCEHS